jgi:hypothetical protein
MDGIDFNIYEVKRKMGFGTATYLVLSKDMQSALSTVPYAISVCRLEASRILINKEVAHGIATAVGKKRNRREK